MNERHKHMLQAIAFNTLLLVAAGVIIWTWYASRPPQAQPPSMEERQADIALDYIRTLAAYQQLGKPPALFKKIELVEDDVWVAQLQTEREQSVNHYYLLEIQNGHVIDHDITVTDATGQLSVYSPEPEEIIGLSSVMVKGKALPGASVQAQTDGASASAVADANTGEFALTLTPLPSGPYTLRIEAGQARLDIPIIVQINTL